MKNIALTFILSAITLVMFAQPELVTGPAISIDKDVHDYGDIAFDADGGCEFKVTNSGTEPLVLSNCQGSCGCTVPKCDPTPIAPGGTSIISVKYDTKRPGPFTKSVTINSNATNAPVKVVTIKGNVGSDPNLAPTGAPVKAPNGAPEKH